MDLYALDHLTDYGIVIAVFVSFSVIDGFLNFAQPLLQGFTVGLAFLNRLNATVELLDFFRNLLEVHLVALYVFATLYGLVDHGDHALV